MGLTARLNALPFDDLEGRQALLADIFGKPVPDSLSILSPFHCDYGLGASFGEHTHAPIVIEDDVWIGAAVTVTPGVTIGRGSVVGAGAVVARDVPPMSVVTATSIVERRRLGSAPVGER